METERPNWLPAAPSEARSFWLSVQAPVAGSRANTYAAPESTPLSSLKVAPTIAVLPLMETEAPNSSPAAPSEAKSFWLSVQTPVAGSRTYTYTAPESAPLSSLKRAPTITVSPLMETGRPNLSPAAPSEARIFWYSVQTPVAGSRVNIYAAPESVPLSSLRNAPTIAVSPLMETEPPKASVLVA